MGKPKLTEEMLRRMVQLKREGLNDKDIIDAVGIHHSTFYRWINEPKTSLQRALSEELKKAEADYKGELLNVVKGAALAKHSFWTAAAWLLERKYPDEFSLNRAEKRDAENAPQVVLGVTVQAVGGDDGADG